MSMARARYIDPAMLDDFQLKLDISLCRVKRKFTRAADISLYQVMKFCLDTNTSPGCVFEFLGLPPEVPAPIQLVSEFKFRKDIGKAFQARREAIGMKPLVVASVAGIKLNHVVRYEEGRIDIRPLSFFKTAAALQMAPLEATLLAVQSAQDWSMLPVPKAA